MMDMTFDKGNDFYLKCVTFFHTFFGNYIIFVIFGKKKQDNKHLQLNNKLDPKIWWYSLEFITKSIYN